jgi:type VI secretion system protein ImpH
LHRFLPEREVVGELAHPSAEVVRFVSNPSLCFPASEIQSISWSEQKPPAMMVNFIGLSGPQGVLPILYTELVMERERAPDPALRDFLDILNHRITSLFYEAWEKYRFTVAYERSDRDRLSRCLLDLIGLGTATRHSRQSVLDDSLLYYAGLFGQHPRSATALRQLLSDYSDVGVEIEQFAGAWYRLDLGAQCRLKNGNSGSEQLGFGAVVGDEVWNQQSVVRIKFGPLKLAQYLDFLPNGPAFEPLLVLTRFSPEMNWISRFNSY